MQRATTVDKDFKIWYGNSDNNWIMFSGDDTTVSLTNDVGFQAGCVNIDREKQTGQKRYILAFLSHFVIYRIIACH